MSQAPWGLSDMHDHHECILIVTGSSNHCHLQCKNDKRLLMRFMVMTSPLVLYWLPSQFLAGA